MQLPCMDQLAAIFGVTQRSISSGAAVPGRLASTTSCNVFVFLSRVKLKEGVTFLGARPSNPTQWIVSQDVRSEGHRVVTLHCRRKESAFDQQRSVKNLLDHKEELHKKTHESKREGKSYLHCTTSPVGRCVNFKGCD